MTTNQKLPIVLAHGIARFDILRENLKSKFHIPDNEVDERLQYFKGIKSHLETPPHEFNVFRTNQDFAGSVELRAEQLRDRINEITTSTGASKVHIIAHSMGGLDARHMIVDKGMADKVASLTTIGAPHLGTILADHVINHGGVFLIEGLSRVIDLDGFADLTVAACQQFNSRAEDEEARNGVLYQTYASFEQLNQVFAPLIPSWLFIRDHEGRNDGLVPFKSQQWKSELVAHDGSRKTVLQREFPLPADHLNQVGWWDPQEVINPFKSLTNIVKEAEDYESKIRNVYLDIAQNLQLTNPL
ncbi:MAG TPA: alpha/beta fold hydrolase [Pyrinomonadaceae bacterium]|jgi:triacylglycerol lipase